MPVELSGAGMWAGVQLTPHTLQGTLSPVPACCVPCSPPQPHHSLSSGQEELLRCNGERCGGACWQPCSRKQRRSGLGHLGAQCTQLGPCTPAAGHSLADAELLFHSPVSKQRVGDWHWPALRCSRKHHFMLLLVRHSMTSLLFARGCWGRRCALRCTGRFDTRVLLY